MFAINAFDLLIFIGYLALLGTIVVVTKRKQETTKDYFLGGQDIPFWAAGLSLLATALSATTFIAVPTASYNGNLGFLASNIGAVIGLLVVAFFFLPRFYQYKVQTVYGYLAVKFGDRTAMLASWMFLIGRVMASGARLFVAAAALVYIVIPLWGGHASKEIIAIFMLMSLGAAYCYWGGIRSVIWTDVAQTIVLIVAGLAALLWLLYIIPLNLGEIITLLEQPSPDEPSKLIVFDIGFLDFDPASAYTLTAILLGHSLINMGAYGTDQDITQRMLTCKDARSSAKSALFGMAVNIPTVFMFLCIGLLLYVFYEHHHYLFGQASVGYEVDTQARVFAQFIALEMPHGLKGLLLVGLFAAAVSGITSELNAISSTFVNDTYRRFVTNKAEQHYVRVGKITTLVTGLSLASFAAVCIYLQQASQSILLDFVFMVMVYAYSGLLAVFLTALFTNRGNQVSTIVGLCTGFVLVTYMQVITDIGTWLAFPWQMLIATSAAFCVCCLGKRNYQHIND